MNFTKYSLAAIALLLGSLASSSLTLAAIAPQELLQQNQSGDRIEVISESRYFTTRAMKKSKKKKTKKKARKSKKSKTIAQIRKGAIKDTLNGLKELRPYAKNYSGLKSAVRRYWKNHVRRPSAKALAKLIMRYVKRQDKSLVRSDVFSGAKSGVRKVKKQLAKRKK
ncbi:MAG: hypothetical protein L3J67_08845 [Hyphomicrobiaceae bacterium]|nr:hypothetical protein [Hyphomicrobiaceae bacterium]